MALISRTHVLGSFTCFYFEGKGYADERLVDNNGLLITYSAEDGGECKEDVNVDVANEIIEKLSISFTEFLLDD
jgi:hypothetical protein